MQRADLFGSPKSKVFPTHTGPLRTVLNKHLFKMHLVDEVITWQWI